MHTVSNNKCKCPCCSQVSLCLETSPSPLYIPLPITLLGPITILPRRNRLPILGNLPQMTQLHIQGPSQPSKKINPILLRLTQSITRSLDFTKQTSFLRGCILP